MPIFAEVRGRAGPGGTSAIRVSGQIAPEVWNKLGVRILRPLKVGTNIRRGIEFACDAAASDAAAIRAELPQAIADCGSMPRSASRRHEST